MVFKSASFLSLKCKYFYLFLFLFFTFFTFLAIFVLFLQLRNIYGLPCVCRLRNNTRVCTLSNQTSCDPYSNPELKLELSHSQESTILLESFSKNESFYPTTLNLSDNHLQQINLDLLTRFSNVFAIYLSYNQLVFFNNIYQSLNKFNNLEILDLDHNNIVAVDFTNMATTRELNMLNLPHNNLKKFLGNFVVNRLNLQYNNLAYLKSDFLENVNSLKDLDLQYNNLYKLDSKVFQNLTDLEDLRLSHNNLEDLDSETFSHLNSLKNLELQFNNLTEIYSRSFKFLTNLENLNISHNNLVVVSRLSFRNLFKLKQLDLSHNSIFHFDWTTFTNLSNLEFLAVNHNDLRYLSFDDLFVNSTSLNILHLNENPRLNRYNLLTIIEECRKRQITAEPKLYNEDQIEMTDEEIEIEKIIYLYNPMLALTIVVLLTLIFNVYWCRCQSQKIYKEEKKSRRSYKTVIQNC